MIVKRGCMNLGDRFTYVQRGCGALSTARVKAASWPFGEATPAGAFAAVDSSQTTLWFYAEDEGIHWTRDNSRESLIALLAASAVADAA